MGNSLGREYAGAWVDNPRYHFVSFVDDSHLISLKAPSKGHLIMFPKGVGKFVGQESGDYASVSAKSSLLARGRNFSKGGANQT